VPKQCPNPPEAVVLHGGWWLENQSAVKSITSEILISPPEVLEAAWAGRKIIWHIWPDWREWHGARSG